MDEDDVYYRELTVSEERDYNNFINSPDFMKFMIRWPALIVNKYYVMKYKDNYDDSDEEPTIMLVGYFLGIDNRVGHDPYLVFSINNNLSLQDYFSMNTHRSRIENGIFYVGLSFEDEFFDMSKYLNFQKYIRNESRRRPVTQQPPSRRRRQSKTRSKSPKEKLLNQEVNYDINYYNNLILL
jgi:hypothetical protein